MPKTILDDINDGVMPLPKAGKKLNFDDIKPLPNAPYRTPEQRQKDLDKALKDFADSEKIPPKGKQKFDISTDSDLLPKKKGGKVTTAQQNPKHKNCW